MLMVTILNYKYLPTKRNLISRNLKIYDFKLKLLFIKITQFLFQLAIKILY